MPPNHEESIPLISTVTPTASEADTGSIASLSTVTPPRRSSSPPPPSYHADAYPLQSRTPSPVHKPAINIYASDLDAAGVQRILDAARASHVVNVHLTANAEGGDEERGAQGLALARLKHRHERAQLFCGCFVGIVGIVVAGFMVWAIADGVVRWRGLGHG